MVVQAVLLICCLLAVVPLRNKNNKTLFSFVMIGLLVCVFVGTNDSVDQSAYAILYQDNSYFSVEKGYLILSSFFASIGLNYLQFKATILFIGVVLLMIRVKYLEGIDYRIIVLLWGLTSFWFDVEQSRCTFAMALILFATKYLEEKSLSNAIKYVIFVLIAFTIHTSVIVYLLFLLAYISNKKLNIFICISCLVSLIFIIVPELFLGFGELLYRMIPNERILMWFSFRTRYGWLGPFSLQLASFFILWYGRKIINQQSDLENGTINNRLFYATTYKISAISFAFIPFYFISTEFVRLIRGLLLLFFISLYIAYLYSNKNKRIELAVFVTMYVVLFNIQGLRGILFYNEYFIENLIMKNDINTNPNLLMYSLPFVLLSLLIMCKRAKSKTARSGYNPQVFDGL